MWGPFAQYVRPYRGRILLGALCIGLGQAATARIPLLVGDAVDAVLTPDTASEQVETYVFYILAYALGVARVRLRYADAVGPHRQPHRIRHPHSVFCPPAQAAAVVLPAAPHRRPHGAGDQRSPLCAYFLGLWHSRHRRYRLGADLHPRLHVPARLETGSAGADTHAAF